MSVLSVQNIQETFVGAVGKSRTATQVIDPNASGYITDGEIVVVNSSGTIVDGTTASTYNTTPFIQIVERNGDTLTWSSKIYTDKVLRYKGRLGAQGQEQIYHIGYDGVTATKALDITAGLDYQLTLIENQDDMMWSEQKKKNVTSVPNNLVTSQQDLAKAIVKNVMKKYVTDGLSVTAAMLNNGTTTAITGTWTSAKVVNGSPYVTFNATGTVTNVAAGTILRIGTTTGGASGVGAGVPVYTVANVQTVNTVVIVTLDQPYAGPTDSAMVSANMQVLNTVGASWGVRFTGKALPFRRDFFKFKRVSFTVQLSGFGSTLITKTQDVAYGFGDGRLVLEEESFSKGFQGALNRMTVPLPTANETFQASATTGLSYASVTTYGDAFTISTPGGASNLYDAITIEFYSTDRQTVVAGPDMMQLIKIFSPDTAGQNTAAGTGIRPALNAFMGQASVGSFTALTASEFN